MNDKLFSIGSFDVTPVMLVCVFLFIILVIAVIAFRKNYILQVNLSQLVDPESAIHNAQGTIVVLKKRAKKIRKASPNNPQSIVALRIDNLGTLYVGYKDRMKLMRSIVQVMRYDLHDKEFVTRLDFDKFCIVMTDRDRAQIKEYILQLNEKLDELEIEHYGLYSFFLTAGVYMGAPLTYPRQDLELAMATLSYATLKDDNIYFYNDDVLAKVKLIETMNTSKEAAFESNQFNPYVLPKVDFKTGRVVGGELLVRWTNGDQEVLYYPDEFIPLFESNGFIKNIDLLMFEKACELSQACTNSGHPNVIISSNFSRLTLNSLKAIDKMIAIAQQYGVSTSNIEIEILEIQFLQSLNNFDRSLQKLKGAGFRIALDDFGKESSSLYLLSNNKFDTIKVDRQFFGSNLGSDKEKHVAKNVVNLLTKVGNSVVLEGIESKQSLDYLATVSRDVILQGYYFTRPVPYNQFLPFLDKIYEFDYPDIEIDDGKNKIEISGVDADKVEASVQTNPNGAGGSTSINISGLGGPTVLPNNNDKELEEMRRQMDEMRHHFDMSLEEQRRLAHEEEIKRMQAEMEKLRNKQPDPQPQPVVVNNNSSEIDALRLEIEKLRLLHTQNQPQPEKKDYRDEEIYRLQRQIDDLRYDRRDRERYYDERNRFVVTDRFVNISDRDREHELLQRQIDELRNKNQQRPVVQTQTKINIDELIDKLSKTQNEQAKLAAERTAAQFKDIRDMLEQERKEREEVEALLLELKNKEPEPVVNEEEQIKEQEEADANLNLDISSLSRVDVDDDDDDEDDDDAEQLEKPKLSLEELEAIIDSYREKYNDDWNQHAKEELQVGYYEVINGLKYYEQRKRRTFAEKMKNAPADLKQLYNILKNEFMKYKGVSNRLTNSYDCFYIGRNQVAKLSLTKKKMKVFLAVDPNAYPEKQFPHKDVSEKKAHSRTPYYTMVKSQLSVKRVSKVILDLMDSNGLLINPGYKPVDYATKFKYMKTED